MKKLAEECESMYNLLLGDTSNDIGTFPCAAISLSQTGYNSTVVGRGRKLK